MAQQTDQAQIAKLEAENARLRAENSALQAHQTARSRHQPVAWRSVFSYSLLVLGLLTLIPAGIVVWLHRTVVRPESYIASVGPVIQQSAVRDAIQKTATDQLFSRVNLEQSVAQALPEQAQFLAPPFASQVENYASSTIGTIVASPRFAQVWVDVNAKAQAAFMNIARNSSGNPNINLNQVYSFISAQLESTPLAGLANKQLPSSVGNIQVATIPALERIPHFVAVLDNWVWGLVGLVIILLAGAVGLAKNRRRSLVWAGFGVIVTALLTQVIVRISRTALINPIQDPTYNAAAVAVWRTILTPFFYQILVTSLLGLGMILIAWMLGPGRVAVRARESSGQMLANARMSMLPQTDQSSAVLYMRRHERALQWGLLGLTLLALALNIPLTLPVVLTIALIALLAVVVLEFFVATPLPGQNKE